MRTKKILGIGCGVLVVGAIVLAGTLTWYSREWSRAHKELKASEEALAAAHGDAASFSAPDGGVPAADRLAAFLAVREATSEWRTRAAAETERFAAATGADGGTAGFWSTFRGADELFRVYAGFWKARNEALLAEGMGPGEYEWLYGQVYYVWLGRDPEAGRAENAEHTSWIEPRWRHWREAAAAGPPEGLESLLEPLRTEVAATWSATTNPIELIFEFSDAGPETGGGP